MTELPTVVTEQLVAPAPRQALLLLKKEGPLSLVDLSSRLGISKMGAHKHLTSLEERGLVERFYERSGVGRPRVWFRLTDRSKVLFPRAYSDISRTALSFIERKLGRGAVEEVLRERQRELYARYSGKLAGKDGLERVKELARLRDEDGYMAEARRAGKVSLELLEIIVLF